MEGKTKLVGLYWTALISKALGNINTSTALLLARAGLKEKKRLF